MLTWGHMRRTIAIEVSLEKQLIKRLIPFLLCATFGCDDISRTSANLVCGGSVGCQTGFICNENTNQCVAARDSGGATDATAALDSSIIDVDAAISETDMATLDATLPDGDGDGIADEADNCPVIDNTDQADGDNDGLGDACDPRPTHADLKLNGHFLLFGGLLVDDAHTLTGNGRSAHGVVTDGELRLRGGFSP